MILSVMEAGFGSVQIPLAGGEICGYLGLMNSSMILYPEQIILDAEIAMNVYDTYKAFEFKDLDISLGVIKEVGPGGHFLRQKHTREHIRDFHYSPIFHHHEAGNLKEPREIAFAECMRIYENHQPEPLSDVKLKELDQVLASADKTEKSLGS